MYPDNTEAVQPFPTFWLPTHSPERSEGKYVYLLHSIACVLEQLALRNAKDADIPSPFAGSHPPPISILDYGLRLHKYMKCSPSAFVSALVYIDRAILRCPTVSITHLTVHRLLFAALVCSCKFWDDVFFTNAYYAKVGGLKPAELTQLELNFLFSVEFDLHIKPEEWSQYFEQLTLHVLDNQCLGHSALFPQQLTILENEVDPAYLTANNDDEIAALGGATRSISGREKLGLDFSKVPQDTAEEWEEDYDEKESEEEEDWEDALARRNASTSDGNGNDSLQPADPGDWESQLQENASEQQSEDWNWKTEVAYPTSAERVL